MKIGPLDTSSKVALIAEIGNNHEGSAGRAEELIEAAFASGADAVKLQTFVPELYVSKAQPARLEQLKRFSLCDDDLHRLLETFGSRGMPVFSTPFDLISLQQLSLAPLIKISSGDITFAQLLIAAARAKKDMIISTGASDLFEVQWAVDLVRSTWEEVRYRGSLAVLHCVSAYPAPNDSLNLRAIVALGQALPETVIGYSDHALGIEAAVAAVGMGARIIEKHFTLDKKYSSFRDHQLSATPCEFEDLRNRIDELQEMLGTGEKVPHRVEAEMRTVIRRSLATSRNLPEGHKLGADDVCIVRPGSGLAPARLDDVLGRTLRRSTTAGHTLTETDVL